MFLRRVQSGFDQVQDPVGSLLPHPGDQGLQGPGPRVPGAWQERRLSDQDHQPHAARDIHRNPRSGKRH